jgi:hypothetical protein
VGGNPQTVSGCATSTDGCAGPSENLSAVLRLCSTVGAPPPPVRPPRGHPRTWPKDQRPSPVEPRTPTGARGSCVAAAPLHRRRHAPPRHRAEGWPAPVILCSKPSQGPHARIQEKGGG